MSVSERERRQLTLTRAERIAHLAKRVERHTRIQRVIEVQRARKFRHG